MRRYSNTDEIFVDVDKVASRIKLTAIHVEAPSVFSDEDAAAVSGTEVYAIPSTNTKEEYLEFLNESKDVFVTNLGHTVEVEDMSGLAVSEPFGVYDNNSLDKDKSLQIRENGGVFTTHVFVDRHVIAADDDLIYAPNISTSTRGISSITGTTAAVMVNGRRTLECTTDVLIGVEKLKVVQEEFIRARHTHHNVHLHKNGRIVYSMQQDDEVELSLVDDNRGLLVDMPAFAWFRDGEEQLALDRAIAFAKVQGASLFQRESVTYVADFPVDIHSVVVVRAASVYNVFATRVDGQRVLVYTADDVPDGAKFCIVNNQNEKRVIVRPRHTRKTDVTSREVATVMSFEVPVGTTAPQLIMENSSCAVELDATTNILAVANGALTIVDLSAGRHTIALVRTSADFGYFYHINHTTGVRARHTFVTGTAFSDPRLPSDPIKVGAGLRVRAIAVCATEQFEQVMEMMHEDFEGETRVSRTLGTYDESTRTFADGSFFRGEHELHIAGENTDDFRTRRRLLLSQQCANILRVPRELTQKHTTGILPMYDTRFVACNVLDASGKCIYHGDLDASDLSVDEEVYMQDNVLRLFCELVDRQSGNPIVIKQMLWNLAFTLY